MKWKIKKCGCQCGWNKLKVFVFVVEGWMADLIIIRRLIVLLQIQMLWSFLQSPDLFFSSQRPRFFISIINPYKRLKRNLLTCKHFPKEEEMENWNFWSVAKFVSYLSVIVGFRAGDHQGPPGLFSQRLLFVTAEVDKCVLYREWSWLWC